MPRHPPFAQVVAHGTSRRTTFGIAGSRCSTCQACRGPESASTSRCSTEHSLRIPRCRPRGRKGADLQGGSIPARRIHCFARGTQPVRGWGSAPSRRSIVVRSSWRKRAQSSRSSSDTNSPGSAFGRAAAVPSFFGPAFSPHPHVEAVENQLVKPQALLVSGLSGCAAATLRRCACLRVPRSREPKTKGTERA